VHLPFSTKAGPPWPVSAAPALISFLNKAGQATFFLSPAFLFLVRTEAKPMDLAQLIREARQGSAAAQKCLFDLLADKMYIVCRRYVKSRENAEEIMLDGFYKLFRAIDGFRYEGEQAFYGWAKKIMINECLMSLRKKNVFTLITESAAEEIPLDEEVISRLSASEIFSLILQLPLGYRTVFNLYAIEGMSHREVAGLLNISEGTSKSQFSKARSLLQKMILQNGIEYARRKAP
jgi:RNA polymerase sigma-70 factor (ECF subfamily)